MSISSPDRTSREAGAIHRWSWFAATCWTLLLAGAVAYTWLSLQRAACPPPAEHCLAPEAILRISLVHVVLWLAGLSTVGWVRRRLLQEALDRDDVEKRFLMLSEQAPTAYLLLDAEARVLEVNDEWTQMLGFERERAQGRWLGEFLVRSDSARFAQEFERVRRDGTLCEMELTFSHRDFTNVAISLKGRAVRGGFWGHTTRFHCVLHNLTEQRNNEQALTRRDAILEATRLAATRFLHGQADWKDCLQESLKGVGNAAVVSRAYVFKIHNAPPSPVCTSKQWEWVAEGINPQLGNPRLQDLDMTASGYARWIEILSSGKVIAGLVSDLPPSERPLLENHAVRSIAVVPIFVKHVWWGFVGFDECHRERVWLPAELGALQVLAELIGAALEARERETELRTFARAIEQSPATVLITDPAGRITYANQRFTQSSGYRLDEVLGQNPRLLKSGNTPTQNYQHLWSTITQGGLWQGELHNRRKNGEPFSEIASISPIVSPEGEITHYVAVKEDITQRKAMEEQILREREFYRGSMKSARDAIHIVAADGTLRDWNDAFLQHLGYTADEARGLRVFDWDARWTSQELLLKLAALSTHGGILETIHKRKDGSLREVEISAVGIRVQGERHLCASARDITTRKREERRLIASENRYRTLVETSFDLIWEVDPEGRYTFISPGVEKLFGYAPEEVLGRSTFEFMRPDEAARVAGLMAEFGSTARPFTHLEKKYLHRDGREVIVESSGQPFFGPDGELHGYRGNARDVTERRHAEALLRASEERFRVLVENAPGGVFLAEGPVFRYVNRTALRLFGTDSPELLLGSNILERIHPDWHAIVKERMRAGMEQGMDAPPLEEIYLRLDGTPFPVEVSAVQLSFHGHKSAVVFFVDISARKKAEEAMQRAAAAVREAQKMEAIGQLAGGVAHDFNNILTAITLQVSLLQQATGLDADGRGTLRELGDSAARAVTLTRQLLMFSRRSILQIRPLDLNHLVANLLKMLCRLLGENLDVRFLPGHNIPLVAGDPGTLEQVIVNLCVNARDAMASGGQLTLTTRLHELTETDCHGSSDRRPGRFAHLSVSDTGCGMDAATLEHIFEPFFTTKAPGVGTGLGLATVYGIVKQHQGWIEVESQPGAGTTFHVFLPTTSAAPAPPTEPAIEDEANGNGETLLLVEDDPSVRTTLVRVLNRAGYRTFEAVDAADALQKWEDRLDEIDLLVTDLIMPSQLTGMDLVRQLRRSKPGLPAIICSGHPIEGGRLGSTAHERVTFLPKPCSPQGLKRAVRLCLEAARG
jgi:PAS domain S-box-containing protein